MVDVALLDVAVGAGAGAVENVAVAGAVHRDAGADRQAAFLALEDHAGDGAVLHDRRAAEAVQQQVHAALQHQLLAGEFQALRIDGRRPGDDAVVGGGAFAPIGGGGLVGAAPQPARRAGDRVLRQPVEQVGGDALDHLRAGPVGHAVDPDHQAAGGEAAQVVVALQQHDVRAGARRCDGRRRP